MAAVDAAGAASALEESLALVDAGASDVVRAYTLSYLAGVKAELGDETGCLDCLRAAIEHCVHCGDRMGLEGVLSVGVVALVEIDRPRLAAMVATRTNRGAQLAGAALDAYHRACERARLELGPDEFDSLQSRLDALSEDDAIATIRTELDAATAHHLIARELTAASVREHHRRAGRRTATTPTPRAREPDGLVHGRVGE